MLLRSIAAATLIVSLGGCVQRDYLVANPSDGGGPASETRYTSNLSYVANVEVIRLRIDPAFAPDERREILRSVAEWNHALNGYIRFDPVFMVFQPGTAAASAGLAAVDAAVPPRSNAWSILPARGATPPGRRIVLPMALTQPAPHGGGIVMVYREQTGTSALAAAIRHELGHVLGLLHDPASRLMSPRHDPLAQRCIDEAAVSPASARYPSPSSIGARKSHRRASVFPSPTAFDTVVRCERRRRRHGRRRRADAERRA